MSASIRWRPIADGQDIPLMAPQTFMGMIRQGLDRDPFDGGCLSEEDLPILRGMRAACVAERDTKTRGGLGDGLDRLIKALERHGRITLSVTY